MSQFRNNYSLLPKSTQSLAWTTSSSEGVLEQIHLVITLKILPCGCAPVCRMYFTEFIIIISFLPCFCLYLASYRRPPFHSNRYTLVKTLSHSFNDACYYAIYSPVIMPAMVPDTRQLLNCVIIFSPYMIYLLSKF